jgi:hypothetical protein
MSHAHTLGLEKIDYIEMNIPQKHLIFKAGSVKLFFQQASPGFRGSIAFSDNRAFALHPLF